MKANGASAAIVADAIRALQEGQSVTLYFPGHALTVTEIEYSGDEDAPLISANGLDGTEFLVSIDQVLAARYDRPEL